MKTLPLVSIIMPLYNRADLVGETIDSVARQEYEHWELLIVDDGSTDGSYEYVAERSSQTDRMSVFKRHREPKGAPTCRNIGLEKAAGEYVIFLDSDDLLAPHCLTQRVAAFQQHPDHDFLVFPVQTFEKRAGDRDFIYFRYFYQDYLTSFLLQSHWITMSPIWKKEALLRLGGFDETLACMQDGDLHTRALIAKMKFKVWHDKAMIDSYLRVSTSYARISNSISKRKLDSKLNAKQKALHLLEKNGMLSALRERMLAAHYLNISWNFGLLDDYEQASLIWKGAYDRRLCSKRVHIMGQSFIYLVSMTPLKRSATAVAVLKRVYQLFLPKFLLWL